MKLRTIVFAIAALTIVACGQTAEEKVKAFEEAHAAMMQEFQTMMDSLSTDQEKAQAYYEDFVEKYIDFNLEAAKKNVDNQVAVMALGNLMGLIDDAQVDEIISKMSPEMLQDEKVAYMKAGLDARKATAEGMPFVDFTVEHVYGYDRSVDPQPLKKEVKFSDYVGKGKYVLVDFWASWCAPCRAEMPTVKAAFDKYSKKGFGIVGISLDNDENAWKKSIKDMNMTWTHMSDLKGVDCKVALLYGIQSIPYTLLIDQEGTILARNIRGEAIEKKLEELLK